MTQRFIPYDQKIRVPNHTIEDTYKKLIIWLQNNNCNVIRENPPTEIVAEYSGEYTLFEIGPRDIYPKQINVRLASFGENVQLYITITQKIDNMMDEGYIYWSNKLQELYKELGVDEKDIVLSELLPEDMLRKKIDVRIKRVAVIILVSLMIVGFLWDYFKDVSMMYKSVILLPIVFLAIWDLQVYRGRLKQMRG